jgi:stress response protein YsnF
MAKTLVGLYNTLTDAQQVAHDLVAHDFSRRDIQVAVARREASYDEDPYIGEWIIADEGSDLVDTLVDVGVPLGEASSYAEGIRRGGALVVVDASDEGADRGLDIMHRLQPVDINERATQWRQEGETGSASRATSSVATQVRAEARQGRQSDDRRVENQQEVTIPVVEEEISVGKREVERGRVRIHTRVQERPVEESVRLREEKVSVERRPVDRPATEADLKARQDETIELTETVEEAVVSKRARVVEEVVVRKDVHEHTETVRDTVRRKDVDVEQHVDEHLRTGQGPIQRAAAEIRARATPAAIMDFSTYEADYRRHHNATFLRHGAYADYEPAYRYGYELGTNARYRGRDWAALEADAHREWEARHPSTWERFKDAIRYAWDKITEDTTDYTDSHVDRLQTTRVTTTPDFSIYDPDYRQHHSTTFLNRGAYEDYVPAYRYGYDLAMDERYRGRMWEGLEEDFRRGWETLRPGTWERFKDAIRYGWNTVRGRI